MKNEKGDKPSDPQPEFAEQTINLSAPWEGGGPQCVIIRGQPLKELDLIVMERTRVHELYIREEAKTKRLGLIISCILFLAACAIVLFAPSGREIQSYWIGAVLFVVATGVAGYKRIRSKTKLGDFGADQDRQSIKGR